MGRHRAVIKTDLSNKGQSVVEYIMLLLVIVSLMALVFNSPAYKKLFGEESQVFAAMKMYMSYSYRHAGMEKGDDSTPVPGGALTTHESYLIRGGVSGDSSRIFLVNSEYLTY